MQDAPKPTIRFENERKKKSSRLETMRDIIFCKQWSPGNFQLLNFIWLSASSELILFSPVALMKISNFIYGFFQNWFNLVNYRISTSQFFLFLRRRWGWKYPSLKFKGDTVHFLVQTSPSELNYFMANLASPSWPHDHNGGFKISQEKSLIITNHFSITQDSASFFLCSLKPARRHQ